MGQLFTKYRELILYAVIGLSGVLIDLVAFFVLYNALDVPEIPATIVSTSLGIVNNFFWNAHHNFRTKDRLLGRFLRFYAVGAGGIVLTSVLFLVFSTWLGIDANIVKVTSLLPVLALQFALNKVWTFSA